MFKPCPNCGFLVALIAGREASQRCPRCGSALVTEGELLDAVDDAPRRRRDDASGDTAPDHARHAAAAMPRATSDVAARETSADSDDDIPTSARSDEPRAAMRAPSHSTADPDASRPTDATAHDAATDTRTDTDVTPAASPSPDATSIAAPHDGPSFVRRRTRPTSRSGRRWPWLIALPLLALLLAVQLLLAQRAELARDAGWRPLVLQACGVLGCDVAPWHAPRDYAMVARGVRPDSSRPGALRVTATVRNDARWPQPPPVVVLSLSDVDGRLVGVRAVAPGDYGRRAQALVAPGDSLDIAFDVREPSAHVESFDFQLQ